MNKSVLIALIAGGILLFGGVGYYVFSGSSDDGSSSISLETPDGTPMFPGDALSYPVTMTGTIEDPTDPSNNGTFTMRMQDENTWSMTSATDEGTSEMIVTPDAFYMQNPGTDQWVKLPSSQEDASAAADMAISADQLGDYQNNATYLGKQSCNEGTCDTWEWTDPLDGGTATIKISDNRVSEIKTVYDGATSTFTYDYNTPVNIEIPTNVMDMGDLYQ